MKITAWDHTIEIEQASDSPYLAVTADSRESLKLVLNNLELCGTNPFQEFPPPTNEDTLTIYIKPEVLCMLLNFEILNYGV